MNNIKFFEFEEAYHEDKVNHEYPTVSYTQDTDKVWYVQKEAALSMECFDWFSVDMTDIGYYEEPCVISNIYGKVDTYISSLNLPFEVHDETSKDYYGEQVGDLTINSTTVNNVGYYYNESENAMCIIMGNDRHWVRVYANNKISHGYVD